MSPGYDNSRPSRHPPIYFGMYTETLSGGTTYLMATTMGWFWRQPPNPKLGVLRMPLEDLAGVITMMTLTSMITDEPDAMLWKTIPSGRLVAGRDAYITAEETFGAISSYQLWIAVRKPPYVSQMVNSHVGWPRGRWDGLVHHINQAQYYGGIDITRH